ncbi:ATP-Hypothetical protein cassette sub-family A ABC1 member [Nesidiocoris tenuis]|uniref:ABC transporter domain-containing protein n=1 Tax=Nesidiocoris tenuis TaxID=355587 RepID=A0ABN7AWH8_9HEMI|nr:ATP-Hypothetical protein cassette sub-family A ABC1 member [Nesidiocoris tenuis]
MKEDSPMVRVSNAYKTYGHEMVLNGFNMAVRKKQIYGLLGPSGCGKTVLLNCILGIRPLDSGLVELGVTRKSDVGYMPQEIGLFKEFTIKETLTFYGRIFGLNGKAVKTRSAELTAFLELPDWQCLIGKLSGGEQRRVSLAVALLHKPSLLVLDEPTVGIDPLLSMNVWQFLQEATREGVTVILTTHYVEEARMANMVGLMRNGQLLIEDSPTNIMTQLNSDTLEGAFYLLSRDHQASIMGANETPQFPKERYEGKLLNNESFISWNRFLAQLVKNYIWIKRNTVIIGLLLILPVMQSFFYSAGFGHFPKSAKIAAVTDEITFGEFSTDCFSQEIFQGDEDMNCTIAPPFSCYLLQLMNNSADLVVFSSSEEAKNAVLTNDAWAFLHIPANFSVGIAQIFLRGPLSAESQEDLDETLDQMAIHVQMDSSDYVINLLLRKMFLEKFRDFVEDLTQSCGLPKRFASMPVRFMEPIFGTKEPEFTDGGLAGFFCSFCFFFTVLFTSGSVMMEKLAGVLDRSMVAGMTYFEIVTAHLIVQFVLVFVQKSMMFAVFYGVYSSPFLGSPVLAVAVLFLIELVGVSYGFFITEIFVSDRLVTYATIGITLAVFGVGGIIWPPEGQHPILQNTVWAFPVTPALESYKSITLKGYNLTNYVVWKGVLSCFVWISIFTAATFVVYRTKRRSLK